jgi:glycosyltransferase involved in cell wall biosynthesis|tara:strand:- start:6437 stop:7258 length:822 start_codon:yes stop_codon:yes gene_type:complete
MNNKLVIIILTYNSEKIINETVSAAKKISKNIIIVDSYSKDKTIQIVKKLKCQIIKRRFVNYSEQRNFIIKKCNNIYQWQLHLDSDEILSSVLIKNIKNIIKYNRKNNAYIVKRHIYFLNKKIKFGCNANWHLRLFPSNTSICEEKKYDQHFISKLKVKKIIGALDDRNINDLTSWINNHNKWSSLSATEKITKSKNLVKPKFFGNSIERTKFIKNIILLLPIGFKGFALFITKYFLLLGFLDGKVGFIYCFLNSFWFHTLIDAKKIESKRIK